MASKEAMQIAEQYTPDCGGGFGEKLRAGKVNGLARSIDELRVRDLEQLANRQCSWCAQVDGESIKACNQEGVHWYRCQSPDHPNGHYYPCKSPKVNQAIAALKSTMGDTQ